MAFTGDNSRLAERHFSESCLSLYMFTRFPTAVTLRSCFLTPKQVEHDKGGAGKTGFCSGPVQKPPPVIPAKSTFSLRKSRSYAIGFLGQDRPQGSLERRQKEVLFSTREKCGPREMLSFEDLN